MSISLKNNNIQTFQNANLLQLLSHEPPCSGSKICARQEPGISTKSDMTRCSDSSTRQTQAAAVKSASRAQWLSTR